MYVRKDGGDILGTTLLYVIVVWLLYADHMECYHQYFTVRDPGSLYIPLLFLCYLFFSPSCSTVFHKIFLDDALDFSLQHHSVFQSA